MANEAPSLEAIMAAIKLLVDNGTLTKEQADEQIKLLSQQAQVMNTGNGTLTDEERGTLSGIKQFSNVNKPVKTDAEKEADAVTSAINYSARYGVKLTGKAALKKYGLDNYKPKKGDVIKVGCIPTDDQVRNDKVPLVIKINDEVLPTVEVPLREVGSAVDGIANGLTVLNKDGAELNTVKKVFNAKNLSDDIKNVVDKIVTFDLKAAGIARKTSDTKEIDNLAQEFKIDKLTNKLAEFQLSADDPERKKIQLAEQAMFDKMHEEKEEAKKNEAARQEALEAFASGDADLSAIVSQAAKDFATERSNKYRAKPALSQVIDPMQEAYEKAILDHVTLFKKMPNDIEQQKILQNLWHGKLEQLAAENNLDFNTTKGQLIHATYDNASKFLNHVQTLAKKAMGGNSKAKNALRSLAESDKVTAEQADFINSLLTKVTKNTTDTAGYASGIKNTELLPEITGVIDAKILKEKGKKLKTADPEELKAIDDKIAKLTADKKTIEDYVHEPIGKIKNRISKIDADIAAMDKNIDTYPEDSPIRSRLTFDRNVKQAMRDYLQNRIVTNDDGVEAVKDSDIMGSLTRDDVRRLMQYIKGNRNDTTDKDGRPRDTLANVDPKVNPYLYAELKSRYDYLKGADLLHKYIPDKYKIIPAMSGLGESHIDDKGRVVVSLNGNDDLSKLGVKGASRAKFYATQEERDAEMAMKAKLKQARAAAEIQRRTDEEMANRSTEEQTALNAKNRETLDAAERRNMIEDTNKHEANYRKQGMSEGQIAARKLGDKRALNDDKRVTAAQEYLNTGKANRFLRTNYDGMIKTIYKTFKEGNPDFSIEDAKTKLSFDDYAKAVVSGDSKDIVSRLSNNSKQQRITDAVSQPFEYVDDTDTSDDNTSDYYNYDEDDD